MSMNLNCQKKIRLASLWPGWLFLAVYLLACTPVRAEIEERWLLVFDTSAPMKKRLPGVEAALKTFLGTSGGGHIRADDTIGVWTFCRQLRTGEFPLTTWTPERSAGTISNVVNFVRRQWFAGDTSLEALQPSLGRIIAGSDRLTVLIFCDGNSQMDWTPYDNGINQTFRQNFAGREKSRQPFVLLLRTQQGKFTGCTVNYPPGEMNLPPWPPWPEPPPVISTPPNLPPAPVVSNPPAVVVPALIIMGTNVGTNVGEVEKVASLHPATPASNQVSAKLASGIPAVSNPPARVILPSNIAKTSGPAKTSKNEPSLFLLTAGGTLLVVGLLLVLLAVVRSRRPINSLITDSLNAPKVPPREK